MADNFGIRQSGTRVNDGEGFYATPAANVAAGAVFMPAYSTSPMFGVAEKPVASGELGWFATQGTFAFTRPTGYVSAAGKAVYYKPTSASAGDFSATNSNGSIILGYEVVRPDVPSALIYVDLIRPTALTSGLT